MMGGFLSRLLLLAFGYAYPAYECYKTVELNRPEIEQLLFWCQYWILVAVLTVLERFGDALISWLPLYNEAKLAFFIYLWYPKTKGTTYIYEGFFKPYLAKHESDIDRNLLELRVRAIDFAALYWQKAATFSQSTFFDVLQYVATQSNRPRRGAAQKAPPATVPQEQQQKKPTQLRRTISDRQQASTSANTPAENSSNPRLRRVVSGRSGLVPVASTASDSTESTPKSVGTDPGMGLTNPEPSAPPAIIEEEEQLEMEEEVVEGEEIEADDVPAETEETPMDEAIRVTRARLRKRVATSGVSPTAPA
ncbi:HVA22-like protein [Rhynchospora pubera]|nr:HVA22-like protein [Rhynchospora pubera]